MINLIEEKFKRYQETLKIEERPSESYTLLEIREKTGFSEELISKFLEELLKEGTIETVTYLKEVTDKGVEIRETVIKAK